MRLIYNIFASVMLIWSNFISINQLFTFKDEIINKENYKKLFSTLYHMSIYPCSFNFVNLFLKPLHLFTCVNPSLLFNLMLTLTYGRHVICTCEIKEKNEENKKKKK